MLSEKRVCEIVMKLAAKHSGARVNDKMFHVPKLRQLIWTPVYLDIYLVRSLVIYL